jgi:SHS2 domain-containing protein
MKNYQYLDHTADLGIEVQGKTLEELFENIGIAIFETQIAGTVRAVETRNIELFNDLLEELFVDWCRELLYDFAVYGFIPKIYEISIENKKLRARLQGESLDLKRHKIKTEIKNVTYHDLTIRKINDHFQATVIFDV